MDEQKKKLTEQETRQVAGGKVGFSIVTTAMKCSVCGYCTLWNGQYSGQYDCPECHAKGTFSPV